MTETEQATEQQDAATAAGESGGNPAECAGDDADHAAAAGDNSAAANGETTAAAAGAGNAAAIDADDGNATTAADDAAAAAAATTADGGAAAVADGAAAAVDEFAVLAQENQRLEQQVQENLDKALRITAEMDNLRKRTARDMENAHKYALERFAKELLPVADSMERGIDAAAAADAAALREGMELTLKMFFDCLDRFGVRPIEPLGEKFDPEWHEAVSMQDAKDHEAGLVMEVMQKGYELNGRLLRPAMVVVAR